MKKSFIEKAIAFISQQVDSEGGKALTPEIENWIENFAQTLDDKEKNNENE